MAVENIVRTVLGILGNIISIGMFLAPVPTFWRIIKWRDTRGYSGVPYAATIMNCALWVLYGMPFVKPNSILVVTVNGVGLILEISYTLIFLFCCKHIRTTLKIIGLVAIIVIAYVLVATLTLKLVSSYTERANIIGTISIVFNIVMYIAPLSIMKRVIQEKSVKYMPLPLSIANGCNALIWTAYGCIHFDRNLVIPNALGLFLSGMQVTLYGTYYKSTKWEEEEEEKSEQKAADDQSRSVEIRNWSKPKGGPANNA